MKHFNSCGGPKDHPPLGLKLGLKLDKTSQDLNFWYRHKNVLFVPIDHLDKYCNDKCYSDNCPLVSILLVKFMSFQTCSRLPSGNFLWGLLLLLLLLLFLFLRHMGNKVNFSQRLRMSG